MAFANGLTVSERRSEGCNLFYIDYDHYDYVEQERRDHPYEDSFYMPPLQVPSYLSGALLEQALSSSEEEDNDETTKLTTLHLADLSHLDADGVEMLLKLVASRVWNFVELGARHEEGVEPMLAVLDVLVSNDNCKRFAGGCRFQNEVVAHRIFNLLQTTQRLQYLKLWGKLTTPTALRLAELVQTSPTLQKVEFGHLTIHDSQAKEQLADAVLQNTKIDLLYLYYSESHVQPVEGIWEKLLEQGCQRTFRYAYIPDCKSHHLEGLLKQNLVEHVHLQRCSHCLPSIANGLALNKTLKILDLSRHTYNVSELLGIWKSIEDHPCIEIISFRGASFVLEDEKDGDRRIVGADYLAATRPEMAGIARVLIINRSKWIKHGGSNKSPAGAWPLLIDKVQTLVDGLGRVETLYYLLKHRLDWIPT